MQTPYHCSVSFAALYAILRSAGAGQEVLHRGGEEVRRQARLRPGTRVRLHGGGCHMVSHTARAVGAVRDHAVAATGATKCLPRRLRRLTCLCLCSADGPGGRPAGAGHGRAGQGGRGDAAAVRVCDRGRGKGEVVAIDREHSAPLEWTGPSSR